MEFGKRALGGSNGQAAFALVVGLMQVLKERGVLKKTDLVDAAARAEKMLPNDKNTRDRETRELVTSLKLFDL